jgi:hypothetical protein
MKVIIYNTKEAAVADQARTYELLPDDRKYIFIDPNGITPSIPAVGVYYSDLYYNTDKTLWALSADESVDALLGKTSEEVDRGIWTKE